MEEAAWEAYELPVLSEAPPDDMFTSLREQLDKVREWNGMRRWNFTAADFDAVDLTSRMHSRPLVVDLVAVYLKGEGNLDAVRHTADELWLMAALEQPNSWCWDDWYWDQPHSGLKPLRLARGIVHKPGIRRVTVDLGAHWQPGRHVTALSVMDTASAHAEVLAAAAHFPNWVRAMDGRTVPYTWLAGYQVTIPPYSRHYRVPCMTWTRYRQMLSLTSHEAAYTQFGWAAPVVLPS
ncbi:MAG: hypothetical protein ABJA34_02330 [Pseudonocardiales bacterium]